MAFSANCWIFVGSTSPVYCFTRAMASAISVMESPYPAVYMSFMTALYPSISSAVAPMLPCSFLDAESISSTSDTALCTPLARRPMPFSIAAEAREPFRTSPNSPAWSALSARLSATSSRLLSYRSAASAACWSAVWFCASSAEASSILFASCFASSDASPNSRTALAYSCFSFRTVSCCSFMVRFSRS